MSLFQCKTCGCIENTACAGRGWEGKPSNCSGCEAPTMALPGRPPEWKMGIPKWHGKFERVYLPKGQYETNPNTGELRHKKSGHAAREEDERKTEWPDP